MKFTEYADREMLTMNVANVLASELENALLGNEAASFAVAGGSTPGPIFDLLSGTDLDWARIKVMLTDERWVPEGDALSNTTLVKSRLITDKAVDATFVPFYRADATAEDGAVQVAQTLAPHMPLSVLMLGMGADMHTASLFPGATGVDAAFAEDAPLLCPIHISDHEVARVTLPAHALSGALSKHLVIFGDDKRAALERAQTLPPQDAPIAAVLAGATVHWAA